ncbi:MAG: hypothetical protein V3W43_01885 [Desulfatiglandaceae bacterium]|jgi:hypothetical protein
MRAKRMHEKKRGFWVKPAKLALLLTMLIFWGACSDPNSPPEQAQKVIQLTEPGTGAHFHSVSISRLGQVAWVAAFFAEEIM